MSADTIIPDQYNPQNLNRYSYVLNNPLKYTDPTGHAQCQIKEDCEDMGTTPMGTGLTAKHAKHLRPHPHDDVPDPNPNKHPTLPEPPIGIAEQILGNKYTPAAAAAVQVLSGTVFEIALPFAETPIGLGITIGAFAANRTSSLVGLGSTFYQYKHELNGANFTDVVVSGGTFTLGWIPALTELMAIGSLVYSGIRLEHDAPINISAPGFLKESLE